MKIVIQYLCVLAALSLATACNNGEQSITKSDLPNNTGGDIPADTDDDIPVKIAPDFYFGNDLSYVNEMEDCGAIYQEDNQPKDPFTIMADHGNNLVKVRLWHDPSWQQLVPKTVDGVKPQYNDLEDVIKTLQRAKDNNMDTMLGFHLSDFWADPGRQVMPRAWASFADDDEALESAVYDYISSVLITLNDMGLMPDIVKLGNENNPGMMRTQYLDASWNVNNEQLELTTSGLQRTGDTYNGIMWNAAIRAVRDVGSDATINPKISLHVSGLNKLIDFYDWVISMGITDFDIMGFSYYYAWHQESIDEMGNKIRQLKDKYPNYEVMVVETAYLWDRDNIDGLGNIINTPDPQYTPVSQENQRRYMVDYTREVIDSGGLGVIFWESAWVSTPCRTPWGIGSSHEHVAYFDHRDNNNFHIGGTWMEADYTAPIVDDDNNPVDVTFAVDMTGVDVSAGVYIAGDINEWALQEMSSDGGSIYSVTFSVFPGSEGAFYFLNAEDWGARETVPIDCADYWDSDRGYVIPEIGGEIGVVWSSCASIN